jgi:hypothetical protein
MAKLVCSLGATPCPLLGVKRTWRLTGRMSAYDPKRTLHRDRAMSLLEVKQTLQLTARLSANDPKRTSASSLKVVNFEQTRMRAIN